MAGLDAHAQMAPENPDTLLPGRFYDKSQSSSWWVRELKNVIVVAPKTDSDADTFNVQYPNTQYMGVAGRTIKKIRIVRLDPFGSSINDTTVQKVSGIGRVGNSIHVNTREVIIRNSLLFKEGETVNQFKLADTERFLRSLKYIDDARVIATPLSESEAEVLVVVQDVFPFAVSFGTNFASRANLALTNRNIIGMGYELRAGTFFDTRKDHLWGYEGRFRIPNLGGSFISLQLDYLDKFETQRYGIILNRDFYSASTKFGGNFTAYNSRIELGYQIPGKTIEPTGVRFNYFDGWIGRSFQLNKQSFSKLRKNLTLSVRGQRTYFIDRPENSQDYYYQFQNRNVFLSSLTYSKQAYYKTNLIYNFGRTEDIPYGQLFSIISGREYNEQYNRNYLGAFVSAGYFIPKLGYLSGALTYGTFFNNGPEQGTLDLTVDYFTNLYVIGKFRQRTFISLHHTRQLNSQLYDYLDIDGDVGIPGFRNDSIKGRYRINLSLEQNLFTPWSVWGFRFVLFAFANLSWIGGYSDEYINVERDLYTAFGVGCRIRNNRLIINTLQIRLAYFYNIPPNSQFRYIHFSKETLLEPRNYSPKAPEVIPLY